MSRVWEGVRMTSKERTKALIAFIEDDPEGIITDISIPPPGEREIYQICFGGRFRIEISDFRSYPFEANLFVYTDPYEKFVDGFFLDPAQRLSLRKAMGGDIEDLDSPDLIEFDSLLKEGR